MKRTMTSLFMALAVSLAPVVYGAKPETPKQLKGTTVVTAEKRRN